MEHDQVSRQPNFSTAAGGMRLVAEHLELCENLPAVEGGARLMQRMDTILERLATMEQAMRRGFLDVGQRVDALDRKVTVTNKNFTARMQNSIVVHESVELAPLYSAQTGDLVPGCPRKLADLDRLSAQEAAELLRQLDEPVPRTVDQRRSQLRHAFGVRTRAA
ncbi:hypothetical protein HRG_012872 [Hirsutella rhossiliensis]